MSHHFLHALSAPSESHTFDVEAVMPEVEAHMDRLALSGHVDLTGSMAKGQLSTKGKRVRARLSLHACLSFRVPAPHAIMWASAIELLHNATLIHDDIQDGDTVRRGQPTVWAKHGIAQAINAGDFMLMLPYLALREMPAVKQGPLSMLIAEYATRTVRGQVNELSLKDVGRYSTREYLAACAGKTGALLSLPVVGAAVLGGHSLEQAALFGEPFEKLGILFQLQDDVVDLFGDKGRGVLGCDIYEGKVSALLVELLELAPEYRSIALEIINKPREETTSEDVLLLRDLYQRTGALRAVLERITELESRVLSCALIRSEPGLFDVATRLVSLALAPIAHLLDPAE
jgi:geranylgeranyl diphosphate synthase type I